MGKYKTKIVRVTPETLEVLKLMSNKTGKSLSQTLEAIVLPGKKQTNDSKAK